MEDFSYPDDSCIRFLEDPSLVFSDNLGSEFPCTSDSSVLLVPFDPFSNSFEEVGSVLPEFDVSVVPEFEDGNQYACYHDSGYQLSKSSGIPHVMANSEGEIEESVNSYLVWDEMSENILPELSWTSMDQSPCASCQMLREIIHTNGIYMTKLEIHGRDGNICHAVHLVQCSMDGLQPIIEQEVISFHTENIESVKEFLLSYCRLRRKEGFIVLQDSLSAFYEVICAGMNEMEIPGQATDSLSDGADLGPAIEEPLSQHVADAGPRKSSKSSIAAQRERTGRLQISDLINYFHLPITVAAKELAICPTVLKKICRRNGMRRWPHRKIKSIDRNLFNLEWTLAAGDREDVASITAEIQKLRKERARICSANAASL